MPPGLVIALLALLLGIQPVTTDLYLPALPTLTADLSASMASAQLTFSGLLLAFGCSQLFWGPLSDRWGRRPTLTLGLALYIAASLASALAPSIDWLVAGRILQGAAMGSAVVCGRAVVRDLYPPLAGARAMSRALTGLGLISCLCAPLGGWLTDAMGWRAAMLAPALFGAATLALLLWRFEETLAHKNPHALHPMVLARSAWEVVRNPVFLSFSLLTAATYGGLFVFLAASPFVFIDVLGMGRTPYGLMMLSSSLAYIGGTFLCRRLLVRYGLRHTVALAGGLSLAGGTLMGLLALAQVHSSWALMLPFLLYIVGHGIHQPCGQSAAVGPFPGTAGMASALNGLVMMLLAFAISIWLGRSMDGSTTPMALGVWLWSAVVALTAWTVVQKNGKPHADPI